MTFKKPLLPLLKTIATPVLTFLLGFQVANGRFLSKTLPVSQNLILQPNDRFLILNISRYKYPPVWVKAEELCQAMATKYSESDKTRGFLLVSAK